MRAKSRFLLGMLCGLAATGVLAAANNASGVGGLTAAQIVEKNVAARGGLAVWQALQTLAVTGKMDAGSGDSIARSMRVARGATVPSGKKEQVAVATEAAKAQGDAEVLLPFRLELKSPQKSRLEIDFAGKTAVQVFDGKEGWKLRPFLNRNDVEPFTPDELKAAAAGMNSMRGPLIDYAASGSQVTLDGTEPVDGHPAYKLKITSASGEVRHVWVDTQSFLDVKLEGVPRRMDGRMRTVWIVQRDFRSVQGLKIPFAYETSVEGGTRPHRMAIDTVTVNRPLDDSRFAKPQVPGAGAAPAAATAPAAPPKPKSN